MSTIYGIFHRTNKPIDSYELRTMETNLSYWEADAKGKCEEEYITLGHHMLWNTPESKLENLPRVINFSDNTLIITIDARLDNRKELSVQLEMTDRPLDMITDSELVLAAYHKWGERCPVYFLGDFVFVIWDKDKQHLFCVRDHIGIKSFYYHLSDDIFIFSNDIRGLSSYDKISKKYNNRSVAMCFDGPFGFYDEEDTFYNEIQKLPAATSMKITKKNSSKTIYWDTKNLTKIHYNTYEAYVEKLQDLLVSAVKVRLRTIYPVASHLSGGIDSSSVSVLAARELKKNGKSLFAVNWINTPDEEYDPNYCEWGYSSKIANLEKMEQKYIRLTAEFMADMYNRVDIPNNGLSHFLEEFLVRNEVKKYGVRTILSGWGGDELISNNGYAYYSGLIWQGKFIKVIRKIYEFYSYKKVKYQLLHTIKRFIRELIYPFFYKKMSGLYQEDKDKYMAHEFVTDKFNIFVKGQSFKKLGFYPGVHNEQNRLFKNGHLLQRIESWGSSAYEKKLEYSYPLLDKRIVEFALAIPEDMYAIKEGHQRYFFRQTISDFIPKDIAWNVKNGEPEYVKVWIKVANEFIKLWMQKNKNTKDYKASYVDPVKIIKRIELYLSKQERQIEDNIDIVRILDLISFLSLERKI